MTAIALTIGYVVLFFLALFLLTVACGVVWLGLQCSNRIVRNKRFYQIMFRHVDDKLSYQCVKYLKRYPIYSQNLNELEAWLEKQTTN